MQTNGSTIDTRGLKNENFTFYITLRNGQEHTHIYNALVNQQIFSCVVFVERQFNTRITYKCNRIFITVLALKGLSRARPILASGLSQSLRLFRSACLKYSAVVSIFSSE